MAKAISKNKSKQAPLKQEVVSSPYLPLREIETPFTWTSFKGLSIILIIVALLLFGNTIFNDIALDDGLVFIKNNLVTKGFKGIGAILSHDTFYASIRRYVFGKWRALPSFIVGKFCNRIPGDRHCALVQSSRQRIALRPHRNFINEAAESVYF